MSTEFSQMAGYSESMRLQDWSIVVLTCKYRIQWSITCEYRKFTHRNLHGVRHAIKVGRWIGENLLDDLGGFNGVALSLFDLMNVWLGSI